MASGEVVIGDETSEDLSSETTNKSDTVTAGGGDDTVESGNGSDSVDGGAGDDVLDGGNGKDTIFGGYSSTIHGGAGLDEI
jgi:Ca2+-binding RTX toxin-like protein